MKPFASKIDRIPCPRCGASKLDVVIKGMISSEGKITKAIKQTSNCDVCRRPTQIEELTQEQIKKVETNQPKTMQAKDMYVIKATRKIGDETWHWVKWTGSWDGDAIGELTRAIGDACQTVKLMGEDEVPQVGMQFVQPDGKGKRMLILDECLPAFEDVITTPIFQENFKPFARISDEKIEKLKGAFDDVE